MGVDPIRGKKFKKVDVIFKVDPLDCYETYALESDEN